VDIVDQVPVALVVLVVEVKEEFLTLQTDLDFLQHIQLEEVEVLLVDLILADMLQEQVVLVL